MNLQTFLLNILKFLNDTIVPFLLALAFVVFLWNVVRFFIIEGGNEEKHENARSLAIWSIAAFVIILSLWGIVNLLTEGFGLGNPVPTGSDYLETKEYYFYDNKNAPPDCVDKPVC